MAAPEPEDPFCGAAPGGTTEPRRCLVFCLVMQKLLNIASRIVAALQHGNLPLSTPIRSKIGWFAQQSMPYQRLPTIFLQCCIALTPRTRSAIPPRFLLLLNNSRLSRIRPVATGAGFAAIRRGRRRPRESSATAPTTPAREICRSAWSDRPVPWSPRCRSAGRQRRRPRVRSRSRPWR